MKENGMKKPIKEMERAIKFGLMDPYMRATGKMTKPTEEED
jgi:hypothetical protein